jgi:hypothetical protein
MPLQTEQNEENKKIVTTLNAAEDGEAGLVTYTPGGKVK